MVLKIDIKKLLKNLIIPLGLGLIAGFLTRSDVENFNKTANMPFFAVPGWVFPIVWTILYILMGIASFIIETGKSNIEKKKAITLNYLQLFFNFCWSFIFFTFNAYLFAFIWVIILLILIIFTTVEYYKINKIAAYLLIPYIIWVTFASVLNFSIFLLN